ncbi:hypothetical protein C4K03_1077 [Pseudomonas synxantha]|uniref:Uncharacterized protein n=1 Tax=Pseudomonas synxantha TaxID=47883 RepID=A0A3G7U3K8_9PSED|nr:hypothetical protein [Pseudomonas synxantha]AZE53248.1 hypothetical protein C4K03_1077 [Pseudomonas synxantha]
MFNLNEATISDSDIAEGQQLSNSGFAKGVLFPRARVNNFNIQLRSFTHYPYQDNGYIVVNYGPADLAQDPYRKTLSFAFSDTLTYGRYYFNDNSDILALSYREIYDFGAPSMSAVKNGAGYIDLLFDLEEGFLMAKFTKLEFQQPCAVSPFQMDAFLHADNLEVAPLSKPS